MDFNKNSDYKEISCLNEDKEENCDTINSIEKKKNQFDPFIFGVSTIGPGHIVKDIPCQDSCSYKVLPNKLGIIAVADGLGSALMSDVGSKIAVETAISEAVKIIDENNDIDFEVGLLHTAKSARDALESYAEKNECNLRDLACTLIVVFYSNENAGVAHIGDGGVVAKTKNNLTLVSQPGESEYANEVVPLTSNNWEKNLRIVSNIPDIEMLAVFTDGCQRASLLKTKDGFEPFEQFFDPLFEYALNVDELDQGNSDVEELLSSKKLSDNSEDDKTLVILVAKGERDDE